MQNKDPHRRSFPNTRTSILYLIVVLALSLFVSITRDNNKDHLWMLICVAVSNAPLILILFGSWLWLKPTRKYFFFFFAFIVAIPFIFFGQVFLDFVVDVIFTGGLKLDTRFWRNHGGLKHYVNNVNGAFALTYIFSVPYFFSAAIIKETQLSSKKWPIMGFCIPWLVVWLTFFAYILLNRFN